MSKYKRSIVENIKQEQVFQREQDALQEKYNIENKNVVIVEKSNIYKYTIRMIATLTRVLATIIILVLASIGLVALIYPAPRSDIFCLLNELQNQIFMLIGG